MSAPPVAPADPAAPAAQVASAAPGSQAAFPPPAYSLPQWPGEPGAVDPTGTSYLVVAIGPHPRSREVARTWVDAAEAMAPTVLVVLDTVDAPADHATLAGALEAARTGVRVLVTGGQYDVLLALTQARDAGALPAELTAFVVDTTELPIHCAHCRARHRVTGAPGEEVVCPGCERLLEIHPHLASALGSFLASDARATVL